MKTLKEILHKNLLKEIGDREISTTPKKSVTQSTIPNYNDVTYTFTTKSGNEYIIKFTMLKIPNIIKINNKFITQISNCNSGENPPKFAYIAGIHFTLSDRNETNANDLTNKNEQLELMGMIVNIVKQYMKEYTKCNIFVFGGDREKINLYNQFITKQFTNFTKIKSDIPFPNWDETYYLIKK